jgi:betaine reductase
MGDPVRVVHYVNQFHGGVGGEERANAPVEIRDGVAGPGRALQRALGERGAVVATIVGGDNYMTESRAEALRTVRAALERLAPDVVVAGPAFDAGRYGLACGEVCQLAGQMGIPSVTAMHPENPGVVAFRRDMLVVPTGATAADTAAVLARAAALAVKLAAGTGLGPADEEGYLPRGQRKAGVRERSGAERAIEMVIAKVTGQPFRTELPLELPERVPPAAPLLDLKGARLALITTGGLVPKGNPDRVVRGNSKVWFRYPIADLPGLSGGDWECVHRGFYTAVVDENPNYVLPLNLLREAQADGVVGDLHPWFFSLSGVGTAVADAKRIGGEMARELEASRVDGALLVAT